MQKFENWGDILPAFSSGWLLPVVILLLFAISFHLFANILRYFIKAILRRIGEDISNEVSVALSWPLRILVLVIGLFLALQAATFFPENMLEVFNSLLQAGLLFFVFQILYILILPLGHLLLRADWLISDLMANLLIKLLRAGVVLLGGVSILETFGIAVAPIIAGFGLMGVAVALGAQDLFKNLIGGLLILAEKRFDVGDWIRAEGVIEGIVEDISFRSTLMRRFDMAPVYVPNNSIASALVINFSRLEHYRLYWTIGLEYRTSTEQLREVCTAIETMLSEDEQIVDASKAPLRVRVDKFSDSSIDVMIYCFVNTNDYNEYLQVKEKLALGLKDIVESKGAAFAFPSRSVYIEKDGAEKL